jgi:hypothetical protein
MNITDIKRIPSRGRIIQFLKANGYGTNKISISEKNNMVDKLSVTGDFEHPEEVTKSINQFINILKKYGIKEVKIVLAD